MRYTTILFIIICVYAAQCMHTISKKRMHLWRFNDPYVNQVIQNGWENINGGRYELAAMDFTRLIQKQYSDYDILFGAGLAYYCMHDITKALVYLNESIKDNPQHFEAYYYRAKIYIALGNYTLAQHDLQTLSALSYDKPLICGYYKETNDIAQPWVLVQRKKEASSLLGTLRYD